MKAIYVYKRSVSQAKRVFKRLGYKVKHYNILGERIWVFYDGIGGEQFRIIYQSTKQKEIKNARG